MTETGEIIEEVSPGSIIELPAGVGFTPFDPGKEDESYSNFRKDILRTVASGLGDQYNSLSNDLESVNYSSARFGRDIVIEFWRGIQQFLVDYYLRRVHNEFLECSTLAGNINASFTDMDRIQDSIIWRPRGWQNVDPVKDSAGSTSDISFGLSTRSRELANTGQELEEVYEELKYEKDLAEKYGLTFTDPTGRNPNESTQEDPDSGPGNTQPSATPAADPKPYPGGKPRGARLSDI